MLTGLTAVEAVEAMRAGELRAEEYARALVAEAEAHRHLNAFLAFEPERVVEAAREADRRRARGDSVGLLHGLPIPVKDSVNTAALVTTNGTRALANFRPRTDAAIVTRLVGQGAIVMGKTNLHELSRGWTSNNGAFGAVRNPYDPERIPGGSSGGSASLVGARVAPLAVAEDTWGSIRVPAAMCGTVGFRPTVGRYPNDGIIPLTHGRFDQVGPVARSVADVLLFDRAVTGEAPLAERSLRGVRVGLPLQWFEDLDAEVERIVAAALARLEAAGAVLVRAPLPAVVLGAMDTAQAIIAGENMDAIEAFLREHGAGVSFDQVLAQASPNLRSRYVTTAATEEEYRQALVKREAIAAALEAHFREQRIEALAFPPLLAPAPPLGDNAEMEVRGATLRLRDVVGRNTAMGNCAQLASLVLPAGLTRAGLPVALEFDAWKGRDRELLALGGALEEALGALPPPVAR